MDPLQARDYYQVTRQRGLLLLLEVVGTHRHAIDVYGEKTNRNFKITYL